MTDRTMKEKATKLQELNRELARLQEQADKLKADIQAEMEARAVDELKAGNVLVRWQVVNSARFDAKAFQQQHSLLYEKYLNRGTTRRFSIVSA